MVLQHAYLDIQDISQEKFPMVSTWIREYFLREEAAIAGLCKSVNYSQEYVRLWVKHMQFEASAGSIRNHFPSYAHPLVFEPMLRSMLETLPEACPGLRCSGSFRLFNSNWGYNSYAFRIDSGGIFWDAPILSRQQPQARAFWAAMEQHRMRTIEDLFEKIYESLTPRQRSAAFDLIYDLTDHRGEEISPYEGYDFDDDGFVELHGLVEFACWYFRDCAWEHSGGILDFFRETQTRHRRAGIPFPLPPAFRKWIQK